MSDKSDETIALTATTYPPTKGWRNSNERRKAEPVTTDANPVRAPPYTCVEDKIDCNNNDTL